MDQIECNHRVLISDMKFEMEKGKGEREGGMAEQSGAEQQPTKNGRSLCALAAAAAGAEVGNYSHEIDVRRMEVEGEREREMMPAAMDGCLGSNFER